MFQQLYRTGNASGFAMLGIGLSGFTQAVNPKLKPLNLRASGSSRRPRWSIVERFKRARQLKGCQKLICLSLCETLGGGGGGVGGSTRTPSIQAQQPKKGGGRGGKGRGGGGRGGGVRRGGGVGFSQRERGRFSPPFPIQHAARVGGPRLRHYKTLPKPLIEPHKPVISP